MTATVALEIGMGLILEESTDKQAKRELVVCSDGSGVCQSQSALAVTVASRSVCWAGASCYAESVPLSRTFFGDMVLPHCHGQGFIAPQASEPCPSATLIAKTFQALSHQDTGNKKFPREIPGPYWDSGWQIKSSRLSTVL